MSNETLNWYAGFFKNWSKQLGPKPTAEQLAAVHYLGLRPGKQALANAMALRDVGVTNAQIIQACGNPQLNRMRGLIADGLFKRIPAANTDGGHTVYKCVITPKGEKRIATAEKRAAELAAKGEATGDVAKPAKAATKAKGASKRKAKANPAKADKPTSEPAKPAEGSTVLLPTVAPVSDGNAVMNETPTL